MATYTRTTPIHADTPLKRLFSRHLLTAYFVLAFGLMWLFALPLANCVPFMLTAVFATFIYTWVYNNTGASILLAVLLHAASNAASQWLGTLLSESGLQPPQEGVAGFLATTNWINVIAYGLIALVLIVATRGHLGVNFRNNSR